MNVYTACLIQSSLIGSTPCCNRYEYNFVFFIGPLGACGGKEEKEEVESRGLKQRMMTMPQEPVLNPMEKRELIQMARSQHIERKQ